MQNMKKKVAKGIVKVLNKVLHLEANTASSVVAYDPKAPKELQNYRRTK